MVAQQDRSYQRRVDEAARALLMELENNLVPLGDLMNAAARETEPRYPPVVSDIVWRANLPILTSLGYETLRTCWPDPDRPELQQFSDDARLIVSEPLGDVPGA